MRILYCAIDQVVPGTTGGSVHVTAVADGLAALGHEVHVLVAPGGAFPQGRVNWIAMRPPLGAKQLRWARIGAVKTRARQLGADAIIERYYNFGGEGVLAAAAMGATSVLEVNAPVVDHPGSLKGTLDRALLLQPMQRWRERICRLSDLIVTPNPAILPSGTPPGKIVQLEWGADTARFTPAATGEPPFARPDGTLAIFAGAFRSWHGAIHLAEAIRQLRGRGRHDISAVFVGDGPELPRVRNVARDLDGIVFAGALPHDRMPAALAAADIGVAPFDIGQHAPLALGFYWSPLKIFEYMAAGLPVVAPRVARIPSLVEHDREGWLYDPDAPGSLADALEQLTDVSLRTRLGLAARERAERQYSWQAHCAALVDAIESVKVKGKR